jgi:DNA repair protein RadC
MIYAMSKSTTTPYYGHRQELRDRFLDYGAVSMEDFELLELLLTYAIPYSDVKPLAKGLIEYFGSCSQVLDAPPQVLMGFMGVKEYSAALIHLVKSFVELYLKREALKLKRIPTLASLIDYYRASVGCLKDEQFRVVFLNSQNEILAEEVIQEGTINQTAVYPRKVFELAMHHKAASLILVHNHPSGNLSPSVVDQELTKVIVRAGHALGIAIKDHLIICRDGYFSLAEHNML